MSTQHGVGCRPEQPDHDHDSITGEPQCADCGAPLDAEVVCEDESYACAYSAVPE